MARRVINILGVVLSLALVAPAVPALADNANERPAGPADVERETQRQLDLQRQRDLRHRGWSVIPPRARRGPDARVDDRQRAREADRARAREADRARAREAERARAREAERARAR
ncbi:MAG: hypothetical protein AAF677_08640, partial [Pseudomonadota bacterium]